jgi:alkylhydroperoxidase/carboxymuconolactone decarboxylase family protein YurZ
VSRARRAGPAGAAPAAGSGTPAAARRYDRRMPDDTKPQRIPAELPPLPTELARANPDVWEAYRRLGKACSQAGPLDDRTRRLVKLAFALAIGSEGAVHSHVRRALAEGLGADELLHVATLAIPTVGWPNALAGRSWIEDLVGGEGRS